MARPHCVSPHKAWATPAATACSSLPRAKKNWCWPTARSRTCSHTQKYGPIFLHAQACTHYVSDQLPVWFAYLEPAIVRGYGEDHWIKYETAAVVPGKDLTAQCQKILANPEVAYVHIRSKFNCFQCQVERA
jgi:hypothetical protein